MNIWLVEWIPESLLLLLGPVSLMVIGYLVEKYYTGKITLFANAIALVTYFYRFQNLPFLLVLYINMATILGIVGLISYTVKHPLFETYYHIGKYFSSGITGLVLLWGATSGLS